MRQLEYAVEGKAANLKTFAMDPPGHGGACHEYQIVAPGISSGDKPTSGAPEDFVVAELSFQNGPIGADGNGVNGIQHEDLIAIIDRLEGFQRGPYACESNATALTLLEGTLHALQERTRARIERGVEGTHEV